METFTGTLEELKAIVEQTETPGTWTTGDHNAHTFTARNGAILKWWDNKKKKVHFQGPKLVADALQAACVAVLSVSSEGVLPPTAKTSARAQVFVVHGHDVQSREQLELVLHKLGLQPFVLQNTAGQGLTIIEALERQIGRDGEARFGIVLITPDDVGYAKRDGETAANPRGRQNVVMEMGMLLSSLSRQRVAILVKGHVELPSDAQGIIYLHFNDHVKEIVPKLAERLKQAGFEIDAEQISLAAS